MSENVHIDNQTFLQIFKDYWPTYKRVCKVRKAEEETVEKMMGCGDFAKSFTQYLCPNCSKTTLGLLPI